MTQRYDLRGTYQIHGSEIIGQNCTLLLVSRPADKVTKHKTEKYLLRIDPETGRRSYVSSLYKTDTTGMYSLEYKGTDYCMTVSGGTVEFSHPGGNSFVYHRELVSKNENGDESRS